MFVVNCPTCHCRVEWNEANAWRPFCSQRCKDADFCAWVNEDQTITGDAEISDHFSESGDPDTHR